jgi:hypothetical protein
MKLNNACFALAVLFCVSAADAQVTGSGTANTIPVWTGKTTLGNSAISETGGNMSIGTKKPAARLDVATTSATVPAITGSANATSGTDTGVYGTTASSTEFAAAVSGFATATTGTYIMGYLASPTRRMESVCKVAQPPAALESARVLPDSQTTAAPV